MSTRPIFDRRAAAPLAARLAAGLIGASALAGAAEPGPAPIPATAAAPAPAKSSAWLDAVRRTLKDGTPSVLIVTSEKAPGSREMARDLIGGGAATKARGRVSVAELSAEAEPAQVERMRLSRIPTVVVFRRGRDGGLEPMATRLGLIGGEEFASWLALLGAADQASGAGPARTTTPAPSPVETKLVDTDADAALEPVPAADAPDDEVARAQYANNGTSPSAQTPVPAPAAVYAPPPQPREVYVERPVERRVVRRVVPKPAPRRVVVEEVEEEAPARNLLVRPRHQASPQEEYVEEVEEVEAAPRRVRVAPREYAVERPGSRLLEFEEGDEPSMRLIKPGPLDRLAGMIGNHLRRRALPRIEVDLEEQQTYRVARPRPVAKLAASHVCPAGNPCSPARPCFAPPPPAAPYAHPPQPQNPPPPASPKSTPQTAR